MQKFICPHCGKETEYKEGLEFTFCKNCGGKVKVSEINSATGTVKAKNKSQTGIIIAAIALLVAVIAGLICFFALKNKDDSKKVSHKIETTAEDALSGLFGDDETTEISEITTILESTVTVPSTTEKITVPVTNPKVTKPKATKPKVTKPKVTKPKPVATTQKNQKPTPTKPATTKPVQKLPTTKSEIIKAYNDGFKVALTPVLQGRFMRVMWNWKAVMNII